MAYDLAAFKPEIWSAEAIVARNSNFVMANLVNRSYEKEMSFGDTLHIPSISALTAATVTNDGSDITYTSIDNSTTTDVAIDQHKHASFFLTKRDLKQMLASDKVQAQYTEQAGIALAKAADLSLLQEAANATDTVGTAGTDITDAALRDVAKSLDGADVPVGDRFIVLHPDQLDPLRGIDKIVRADSLGDRNRITKAYEIPEQGFWGEAYGMFIYTSTNVPAGAGSPAGKVNIAFHRDAIALIMQLDAEVEIEYRQRGKRWDVSVDNLYGLKTLRADHVVKLLT